MNKPVWIFLNTTSRNSGFEAMPSRIKPAGCIPSTAGTYCMFFQVVGVPEDLVLFNVKRGIFLYFQQIKNIMNARSIPVPKKPHGSGKGGAVKKQDLAKHLVKGLFPDATEPEYERMFTALMGNVAVKNPDEILKMVGQLNEKEMSHFSKLRDAAVKELDHRSADEEKKKKRSEKLDGTADAASQPRPPLERTAGSLHIGRGLGVPRVVPVRGKAPQEVKDLLPEGVGTCYINFNVNKRNCNVEFRRALFGKQVSFSCILCAILFVHK